MTQLRRFAAFAALATVLAFPGPTPGQDLDDRLIATRIREIYRLDPVVASSAIDVHVVAGIVTLRGTAPDLLGSGRAGLLAQRVRGVREVINDLVLEADGRVADERLRTEIRKAILLGGVTEHDEVKVHVDRGVVTLSGTVDTWKERDETARVVRSVAGVAAIRNDLAVEGPAAHIVGYRGTGSGSQTAPPRATVAAGAFFPPSDAQIRVAVDETLLRDVRVSGARIGTRVTGGRVTLEGTVSGLPAKVAAEEAAWAVVGVRQVVNRLDVEAIELTADGRLFDDVRAVLARDPYTGLRKVSPSVVEGTVYLFGSVDSELERAHAEKLVGQLPGVIVVKNRLLVRPNSGPLVERPYVAPPAATLPPMLPPALPGR